MMDKGVHVTLGTVTTKPGMELKSLSKEEHLFYLTPSASGDDIVGNGNGFQMCFADGDQGKVAAEYVNTLGLEKIGVFFKSDDPYSDGIYKNFTENLSEGIEVVETQFTDANATDFAAQITQLKDCSFIFMPIYYQPAAIFMKQAKDTMAADAIYYGCDGFDGLAGEMDLTTITQEVSMLSHFDANSTEGKAAEFIKKYTEKYGADTLNQFGASAYDCVYALYGAMKELADEGKTITPETSASDLCEMLKEKFNGGYSLAEGTTGSNITWYETGKVNKVATKYTLKEAD
jgi:branched-chain amino acid transport system substrate-binding protein